MKQRDLFTIAGLESDQANFFATAAEGAAMMHGGLSPYYAEQIAELKALGEAFASKAAIIGVLLCNAGVEGVEYKVEWTDLTIEFDDDDDDELMSA